MTDKATIGAKPSANGFTRHTINMSAAEVAKDWTCKKRDGTTVEFDVVKIQKALFRCFHAVSPHTQATEVEAVVAKITKAVVNVIEAKHITTPEVEQIQQFILQQLWSEGLFEQAEHYQNYRENHRKVRKSKAIPADVVARVKQDQKHFPTDLQYYQFMSKFARWRENDNRRETWQEAVHERIMPWLKKVPGAELTEQEWDELTSAAFNLEASPAMRVIQMAGPALDRCNVGVFNCAYQPLSDLFAFPEMLYILMQGTGEGFSCEEEYISELPKIKKQKKVKPDTWVMEDTTESWCDTYYELLQRLWDGYDLHVDASKVRKKGERLRTKGGRASGPEPFLELVAYTRSIVQSKQGRRLDDIDAHDIACMTGKIVQVGGVRRAAEMSLSDLSSHAMRGAKAGTWYDKNKHRTMANNSAVYDFDGPPPIDLFMSEWSALIASKSGERGIFNRRAAIKQSPKRRKWGKHLPGCNPCAEILLRPYEFCNLSMAIARPWDTEETLKQKVRLATIFGKIQSLCTNFNYIRKDWKINCEEERLLGVDITGHADCPLLRFDTPDRKALLQRLAKVVEEVDIALSIRWGVERSAASCTIKPGGDSAVFFNCASGVSAWFAEQQIRWIREPNNSPVAQFLIDSGVQYAPAPEAPESLLVFGFPRKAPKGATLRNDMTAAQQFHNWMEWKQNWAEHSVSATIYVEDHEWLELGHLVYNNFDHITGLAFLPKDNGKYTYAPNEELTPAGYESFSNQFPELNWAKLQEYETEDMTTVSQTFACVGDSC